MLGLHFDTGEWISFGGFTVLFVGQLTRWFMDYRRARAARDKARDQRAAEDKADDLAIAGHAAELKIIRDLLKTQGDAYIAHEIKCTDFQARIMTKNEAMEDVQKTILRTLEGIQHQINNIALGVAPSDVQALPANRPPSRRARRA